MHGVPLDERGIIKTSESSPTSKTPPNFNKHTRNVFDPLVSSEVDDNCWGFFVMHDI